MKKIIFSGILFLLLYACFELFSAAGLAYLARSKDMHYTPADHFSAEQISTIESFLDKSSSYFEFDTATGWTIQDKGRYKDIYRANSAGIRADREYGFDKPARTVRICTFGDSFTHCDDVGNDSTWQVFMEAGRPRFEAINFGVGAYGLDQAYVRYLKKGRCYETDFVLIGFMSENIFRMVNTFRPFYLPGSGLPLSKPRFMLHEDSIVFLPNPLPSLSDYQDLLDNPKTKTREMGVYDYFYHQRYVSGPLDWSPGIRLLKMAIESMVVRFSDEAPIQEGVYNETSEAFIVTTRVFDLFYRSCQEQAVPVILIFPHKGNIKQALHNGTKEYAPLLKHFDSMGYRYIDLMDAFEGELRMDSLDELFVGDHYSAKGNAIVAEYVINYIDGCIAQTGRTGLD